MRDLNIDPKHPDTVHSSRQYRQTADPDGGSTSYDPSDGPVVYFDPDMPHDACDQDDEQETGNP